MTKRISTQNHEMAIDRLRFINAQTFMDGLSRDYSRLLSLLNPLSSFFAVNVDGNFLYRLHSMLHCVHSRVSNESRFICWNVFNIFLLHAPKEFSCEKKLLLAIFSGDKSVECWTMIDIEICESFSWKNNGSFKDVITRWISSSNEHHQLTVWCINYKLNHLEILMEFRGVIKKNCSSTHDDCHGMEKEDIAEIQQSIVLLDVLMTSETNLIKFNSHPGITMRILLSIHSFSIHRL